MGNSRLSRKERIKMGKNDRKQYLNAYYFLKPTGCFKGAEKTFPSHREIYAAMVANCGLPFGTPIENMLAHAGADLKSLKARRDENKARNAQSREQWKANHDFYDSIEWRALRYKALELNGGACQCCGRTRKHGVVLHVDHIKPRSLYPELQLALDNLQILCEDCNLGKSNKFATDWR